MGERHRPGRIRVEKLTQLLAQPSNHAAALARFNRLKSSTIILELNSDASDIAGEYTYHKWGVVRKPPLDKASSRRAATSLFMSFFMNEAYARMADLEVRFIVLHTIPPLSSPIPRSLDPFDR